MFSVPGTTTTFGSKLFQDRHLKQDSFVHRQLNSKGAVLVAKLATGVIAAIALLLQSLQMPFARGLGPGLEHSQTGTSGGLQKWMCRS